jgi:hypothetical protein
MPPERCDHRPDHKGVLVWIVHRGLLQTFTLSQPPHRCVEAALRRRSAQDWPSVECHHPHQPIAPLRPALMAWRGGFFIHDHTSWTNPQDTLAGHLGLILWRDLRHPQAQQRIAPKACLSLGWGVSTKTDHPGCFPPQIRDGKSYKRISASPPVAPLKRTHGRPFAFPQHGPRFDHVAAQRHCIAGLWVGGVMDGGGKHKVP